MNGKSIETNKRSWQENKQINPTLSILLPKLRQEEILEKKNIPSISSHQRIATFDFKFLHALLFWITFFKQLC